MSAKHSQVGLGAVPSWALTMMSSRGEWARAAQLSFSAEAASQRSHSHSSPTSDRQLGLTTRIAGSHSHALAVLPLTLQYGQTALFRPIVPFPRAR